MADRAPARGFANAYAAAKVVTMNLLDLRPRQLKRSTNLKTAKDISLTIPPGRAGAGGQNYQIGHAMAELDKGKPLSLEEVMVSILFG